MTRALPWSRALVAVAILAAACSKDSTAPGTVNPTAFKADAQLAAAPLNTPVTQSLSALGGAVDLALGSSLVAAPSSAIASTGRDPYTVGQRIAARLSAPRTLALANAVPATLAGKTMVFDSTTQRYVVSARTGAPANGVRFILYAVDPLMERPVYPLVETGYADITHAITNGSIAARVQAYAAGASATKVLDYSASLTGLITNPRVLVSGFATNGTDRLDFSLNTSIDLALGRVSVDYQANVPTQGIVTRVQMTVNTQGTPGITIDGRLESRNGSVDMDGTIGIDGTGTVVVAVNGATFATITMNPNGEPTVVNGRGQPLSAAEGEALTQILEWFSEAMATYDGLSRPVGGLLGL